VLALVLVITVSGKATHTPTDGSARDEQETQIRGACDDTS